MGDLSWVEKIGIEQRPEALKKHLQKLTQTIKELQEERNAAEILLRNAEEDWILARQINGVEDDAELTKIIEEENPKLEQNVKKEVAIKDIEEQYQGRDLYNEETAITYRMEETTEIKTPAEKIKETYKNNI